MGGGLQRRGAEPGRGGKGSYGALSGSLLWGLADTLEGQERQEPLLQAGRGYGHEPRCPQGLRHSYDPVTAAPLNKGTHMTSGT